MQIFISYASEEATLADEIQLVLVGAGHKVFFDRADLPPGSDYNTRIREAIAASDIMVFLISPHSMEPGSYTLTELKFAREKWRHPANRVLPVMTETTDLKIVPPFLRVTTYLVPEGNVVAEVAAEVERMYRGRQQVDIVKTLSVVGEELQQDAGKLAAAQGQRRQEIADYFANISNCLHEVHSSLAADIIPHGRCAELEGYADVLPLTVGDYVGAERAGELAGLLSAAHRVEGLWETFNQSPDKRGQLPLIDKLSGKFTALANSVRAGLGPAPRV